MVHNKIFTSLFVLLITVLFIFPMSGCMPANLDPGTETIDVQSPSPIPTVQPTISIKTVEETQQTQAKIVESGTYSSKEDVAQYIRQFHKLPSNFITKSEAEALGWDSNKGNLWKVTDKKSIGGDRFGNREALLPNASERKWYECDIDYKGGYRGSKRIVYSNDGLIYYTNDHYESFTKLY